MTLMQQVGSTGIFSVGNTIGRLLVGFLSDQFLHRVSRAFFLVVPCAVMLLAQLWMAFASVDMVYAVAAVQGLAHGGLFCVFPMLVWYVLACSALPVRAACLCPWLLPLPTHRAVTTLDSPTSGPTGVWQAWHQRSAPRCLVLSWRRLCSGRRVEPAAARASTTRPRSSTRCSSTPACAGSVLRVPGGSSSESCRCGELPSEAHTSSSLRRLCSGIQCLGDGLLGKIQ